MTQDTEHIKFLDYHIYAYDNNNNLKTEKINIPLTLNFLEFENKYREEIKNIKNILNNDYSDLLNIYSNLIKSNFKNCDFKHIILYILYF